MIRLGNIIIGSTDTSISNLIVDLPEFINQFRFVLITCIDSISDVESLPSVGKILHNKGFFHRFIKGKLLIETRTLFELNKSYPLFNGFDEIWMFNKEPSAINLPRFVLVEPLNLNQEMLASLGQWMTHSACIIGLGDGVGLNYVTIDEATAMILEQKYSFD